MMIARRDSQRRSRHRVTMDGTRPNLRTHRTRHRRGDIITSACALLGLCAVVALSAVVTKEAVARAGLRPLASVSAPPTGDDPPVRPPLPLAEWRTGAAAPLSVASPVEMRAPVALSPEVRYFNARPLRPARTISMLVTAYSPDARSCGPSADGVTASVHRVQTNAMRLVAADTRILPLGSMVSVPGYDEGRIVPVLDRGGRIKGNRLDVLFPSDSEARRWGSRRLLVTVWEYADNAPADDFRAIRDSRN